MRWVWLVSYGNVQSSPSLSLLQDCWKSHLMSQIHIDRILLCSCPIYGCNARPTRAFFVKAFGEDSDTIVKVSISLCSSLQTSPFLFLSLLQFNKELVRSYVDQSGWLTWCRNPQGCDQFLCKGDGLSMGACHKCGWTSCFSCIFIEVSCLSRWHGLLPMTSLTCRVDDRLTSQPAVRTSGSGWRLEGSTSE